jgi:hypothetical protein
MSATYKKNYSFTFVKVAEWVGFFALSWSRFAESSCMGSANF